MRLLHGSQRRRLRHDGQRVRPVLKQHDRSQRIAQPAVSICEHHARPATRSHVREEIFHRPAVALRDDGESSVRAGIDRIPADEITIGVHTALKNLLAVGQRQTGDGEKIR